MTTLRMKKSFRKQKKEKEGRKEVSLLMSLSTYASLFADGGENGVQEG